MQYKITDIINALVDINSNTAQLIGTQNQIISDLSVSLANIEAALGSVNSYLSTIEESLSNSAVIGSNLPLPVDQV